MQFVQCPTECLASDCMFCIVSLLRHGIRGVCYTDDAAANRAGRVTGGVKHMIRYMDRNERRAKAREVPTQRVWVTAYAVTREYGGPEEGGWWYDHLEPIQTVMCRRGESDAVIASLVKAHPADLPGGSLSSVAGGHDVEVWAETRYQLARSTYRPRYE